MPQVLEQLDDETTDVLALLRKLLDVRERARGIAIDDEVAEPEERLLVDGPEQLEHGLHRDLAAGRGRQLVEGRHGVTEAALGRAANERERRVRCLEALAVGDPPEQRDELRETRAREEERLTARPDGRQHLVERRRAEDEDEVRRRLLDDLQERVPGGIRQLVRLVEDVDPVAALGLEHRPLPHGTYVVDATLRGCIHLHDVHRRPVGNRHAGVARAVRLGRWPVLAVERLGEDACKGRLAGAARACEEIRLAHLVRLDRVAQRSHDRFLTDDLVEVLWAVLRVERGHASDSSRTAATARDGPSGDEAVLVGPCHGLRSAVDVELAEDVLNVARDRLGTDA